MADLQAVAWPVISFRQTWLAGDSFYNCMWLLEFNFFFFFRLSSQCVWTSPLVSVDSTCFLVLSFFFFLILFPPRRNCFCVILFYSFSVTIPLIYRLSLGVGCLGFFVGNFCKLTLLYVSSLLLSLQGWRLLVVLVGQVVVLPLPSSSWVLSWFTAVCVLLYFGDLFFFLNLLSLSTWMGFLLALPLCVPVMLRVCSL